MGSLAQVQGWKSIAGAESAKLLDETAASLQVAAAGHSQEKSAYFWWCAPGSQPWSLAVAAGAKSAKILAVLLQEEWAALQQVILLLKAALGCCRKTLCLDKAGSGGKACRILRLVYWRRLGCLQMHSLPACLHPNTNQDCQQAPAARQSRKQDNCTADKH